MLCRSSLTVKQFASAVWGYLASNRKVSGAPLEGIVENPSSSRGFIFMGTFTRGVPQGVPFSGTVMVKPGPFRIERPDLPEFYLMAVSCPVYRQAFGYGRHLAGGVGGQPPRVQSGQRACGKAAACACVRSGRRIPRSSSPCPPCLPGAKPWRSKTVSGISGPV